MGKMLCVIKEARLSGSVFIALEAAKNYRGKIDLLIFDEYKTSDIDKLRESYNHIDHVYCKSGINGIASVLISNGSKYDLIFTHSTINGIVTRILNIFLRHRVVHVLHGVAWHDKQPFLLKWLLYIVELSVTLISPHRLVVVNEYYLPFFKKKKNIKHIPNFADRSERVERNITKVHNSLLFIGRLDDQKNPIHFLRIVSEIDEYLRRFNWKVEVVGAGNLDQKCERFVHENDLQDLVRFHGWIDWKSELMLRDCVHCVSSDWEAFGLNIVEAGLLKVPTVAFDVEGLRNVIVDGVSGILVRSEESFMKAITVLIANEELRRYLGDNSRLIYEERFNRDLFNRHYEEIFKG